MEVVDWTLMKAATPVKSWEQCDSCPSPFMRSRNSCEDQPCVTGDRFVTGFAHQVTADAGAVVKAFNTYAKWCSDQAQVDGYQQEILAPAPGAPTPAVYAALAPVVEYTALAPAVFYAAPALVVEYLAPASLAYVAQCRD